MPSSFHLFPFPDAHCPEPHLYVNRPSLLLKDVHPIDSVFVTWDRTLFGVLNEFYKKNAVTKGEYKTLITLLNPVAPHMTEELWEMIGGEGRLYQASWPEYDEAKTVESTVEIAVQINGKTKVTIAIAKDEDKDSVIAKAKEALGSKLSGNIIKEIYVPGHIVNIVAK